MLDQLSSSGRNDPPVNTVAVVFASNHPHLGLQKYLENLVVIADKNAFEGWHAGAPGSTCEESWQIPCPEDSRGK